MQSNVPTIPNQDKFRGNAYFSQNRGQNCLVHMRSTLIIIFKDPRVNKYFPIIFLICLVRTYDERCLQPEVRLNPYDFFLKKRNESNKHNTHIKGAVMSYGSAADRLNFVGHIFLHKLGSRKVSSAIWLVRSV